MTLLVNQGDSVSSQGGGTFAAGHRQDRQEGTRPLPGKARRANPTWTQSTPDDMTEEMGIQQICRLGCRGSGMELSGNALFGTTIALPS